MLSENDIHHIAGLLYVATQELASVITLGEKILDTASGTTRDVDVVIVTAGSIAMIAAEVKHLSRSLDVSLVEGLCLKFIDMPSITDRNIISTSGYSEPAVLKARQHNTRCLTLRSGPLRRLGSIDISHLTDLGYSAPVWSDGPHLVLITDPVFPQSLKKRIRPTLRIRYPQNHSPSIPLAVFQYRMISQVSNYITLPEDSSTVPCRLRLKITDGPYFTLGRKRYRITQVKITGCLGKQNGRVPLSATFTLQDDSGRPFAGAAIAEIQELLIAVATSSGGDRLDILVLPPGIRQLRPVRKKLSRSLSALKRLSWFGT